MTPSRDWPRRRSVGHGIARLILHDYAAAEDAVQESLVEAWRNLRGLRDPDRFDPGSTGSSSDRARTHAGGNRGVAAWSPVARERRTGVRRHAASIAAADQLERGLRLLTIEQRTVLVLAYYLDLSLADAAATLGIPTGTMKSRLNRSLAALRAALDADERRPARTVEQPT